MGREIDSPERTVEERAKVETPRGPDRDTPRLSPERQTIEIRGYRYQISPQEVDTMHEVGRFRTVAVEDLTRYQYGGRAGVMRDDLGSLRAQGLMQERAAWVGGKGGRAEKLSVVVLTKRGKETLETIQPRGADQKYFSGFVKPSEVRHDAAIYRMYQLEADRIKQSGGAVRRVVLDYELKQKVYAPLAKAKALSPLEYARRQAEIASENKLKVIQGKILLPDLRIEYDTASGARAHVDLELATDHYRGSQMRGKAEAGFRFYAPQESVGRLASAFDPDHMSEIFSL